MFCKMHSALGSDTKAVLVKSVWRKFLKSKTKLTDKMLGAKAAFQIEYKLCIV